MSIEYGIVLGKIYTIFAQIYMIKVHKTRFYFLTDNPVEFLLELNHNIAVFII